MIKVHRNGCILAGENITEEEAIAKARAFGGLNGLDLAKECCDPTGFEWSEGSWAVSYTHLTLPTSDLV